MHRKTFNLVFPQTNTPRASSRAMGKCILARGKAKRVSSLRRFEFNLFQHHRITALRLHNDAPAQFIILRTREREQPASRVNLSSAQTDGESWRWWYDLKWIHNDPKRWNGRNYRCIMMCLGAGIRQKCDWNTKRAWSSLFSFSIWPPLVNFVECSSWISKKSQNVDRELSDPVVIHVPGSFVPFQMVI